MGEVGVEVQMNEAVSANLNSRGAREMRWNPLVDGKLAVQWLSVVEKYFEWRLERNMI